MIVSRYPVDFVGSGGVERSCALLASVLEERGLSVTCIAPDRDPARLIYRAGLGSLWLSRHVGSHPSVAESDLIVTSGIFGWGFPTVAPRIHVFHGTLVEMAQAEATRLTPAQRRDAGLPRREMFRRRWGGGAAEWLAARQATVVCVSESTALEVARHYRARADAVIPNGIDLQRFTPHPRAEARARLGLPERDRLALFAGRVNQSKGAAVMLPACERAGYRLVVAGSLGLPGSLHLGRLTPDELSLAYAAADCLLLPSVYEACSFVLLEALACGTPVLTTRVGSVPSLLQSVPEYDALCVEPQVHDVAAKLHYLREADTTALLQRAGAWVAENHSLEQYAARWTDLLNSMGSPSHVTATA